MSLRSLRLFAGLSALSVIAVTAACGGDGGSADGPGSLYYSRLLDTYAIVRYDIANGQESTIVSASDKRIRLADPVFSPDGSRIAYVQTVPDNMPEIADYSTDLWVANRDGSGARRAIEHAGPNEYYFMPQWEDERHIVAVVRRAGDPSNPSTFVFSLERFDVEVGTREHVRLGVVAFGLTPGRDEMVFVDYGSGGALLRGPVSDAPASVLVSDEERMGIFGAPSVSPDGSLVALVVLDHEEAAQRTRSFGRSAPALHGDPFDVWLVPTDGTGTARLLADVDEDEPGVTWGPDSRTLYIVGTDDLFRVDVASDTVTQIGPGGGHVTHTQVAWAPSD